MAAQRARLGRVVRGRRRRALGRGRRLEIRALDGERRAARELDGVAAVFSGRLRDPPALAVVLRGLDEAFDGHYVSALQAVVARRVHVGLIAGRGDVGAHTSLWLSGGVCGIYRSVERQRAQRKARLSAVRVQLKARSVGYIDSVCPLLSEAFWRRRRALHATAQRRERASCPKSAQAPLRDALRAQHKRRARADRPAREEPAKSARKPPQNQS